MVPFNTYIVEKKYAIIEKNDVIKFDKHLILASGSIAIMEEDLKFALDLSVVDALKLSPAKGIEKLLEQTSQEPALLNLLPLEKPEDKEKQSIYSQDYTEMTEEEERNLWETPAKATKS